MLVELCLLKPAHNRGLVKDVNYIVRRVDKAGGSDIGLVLIFPFFAAGTALTRSARREEKNSLGPCL